VEVADGEGGRDAPPPLFAGANRPAHGISGPQERLAVSGTVVVDGVESAVHADQGVGDADPILDLLGGVLVIQDPSGGPGADYQTGGGLKEYAAARGPITPGSRR
jgi:hypothetical protein